MANPKVRLVKISGDKCINWKVFVDDKDISENVRGVCFNSYAGELPTVFIVYRKMDFELPERFLATVVMEESVSSGETMSEVSGQ